MIILATSGLPGSTLTVYILAITFEPMMKEFRNMNRFCYAAVSPWQSCWAALRLTPNGRQAGGM